MVTFKNQGRYGNFLFQMATAYAYAKRHGLEFTVPTTTHDDFWYPVYFTHLANKNYDATKPLVEVKEQAFHYNELPFNEDWRNSNIQLTGYFQTEKYFQEYRQEIIDLFGLYNPFAKSGYAGVFIRRGDYLKPGNADYHVVISRDYIFKGMDHIYQTTGCSKFLVCSDDMAWARANITNPKYHIEFSEGLPFHLEMQLLSSCDHHILSPSSFSWWAAWACQNPNKVVVASSKHFGPKGQYNNTKDWYCPGWEQL